VPEVLKEAAKFTTCDRNILLTLPSFLAPIMAKDLTDFLLQYTLTKYGWSLATVGRFSVVRNFCANIKKATILITTRPATTIQFVLVKREN
jgi:hypothetical protein